METFRPKQRSQGRSGFLPRRRFVMQSMRQLFGKIIPTNWWDTQALIQPRSLLARRLVAKTRRNSSSKRSAGGKVKRRKRHYPNRKSQRSKPGGLNCKCIKHYRRILPIFRKVATGAVNATARVKRPIGAATNSILRLGTGKFHWLRF